MKLCNAWRYLTHSEAIERFGKPNKRRDNFKYVPLPKRLYKEASENILKNNPIVKLTTEELEGLKK